MPIYQTPEGGFDVNVCVKRRRLHRRLAPGTSARDAKRVEAELIRALHVATGPRLPQIPGDPLLSELMADYVVHCNTLRSPDTAKFHAYRIGRWLEGKRASETRAVATKIVDDLAGVYAPATVNRSLGALKKALGMAWARERTPVDYSSLVKRLPENNQREVFLTMDQVKTLADAASQNVRAAIWIALLTGCRRGEICKIRAEHIGTDTITLPAGNTKTLRMRTVPIVPALRPWLKNLPLPITYEGLKTGFRRAREAVGMEHVNFHDLRHSCATILLGLKVPLHVVRDILGHTSVKTTERYAHAMVGPQRLALAKLGRLHQDLHQPKKKAPKGRSKKGASA